MTQYRKSPYWPLVGVVQRLFKLHWSVDGETSMLLQSLWLSHHAAHCAMPVPCVNMPP